MNFAYEQLARKSKVVWKIVSVSENEVSEYLRIMQPVFHQPNTPLTLHSGSDSN